MKQHDDSRKGHFASGGQRIDDHSFWAGGRAKTSVFPDGPHKVKEEHSADSAGSVMEYIDTTEKIRLQQENGEKRIKKHQGRLPVDRN